jgi:hypothetical protein
MTRAECERLGIFSDKELADFGETPKSIAFIRERAESENPTPLADPITAAADRIDAGEPLIDVFADLCRPAPMEKL